MLITMQQDANLDSFGYLVKKLLGWGLQVYIYQKQRPFRIAFFGYGKKINLEDLKSCGGVETMNSDTDFFKERRKDFEAVQWNDSCVILA